MLDLDAKRRELYKKPRWEFWGHLGTFLARWILSLRYRIKVKGLENIKWDKGVLFLPNHPSHFDSLMVISYLWPRFQPRPMAIDYCYWMPVWSVVMKYVRAIPVPNFDEGFSPIKLRRMEGLLKEAGQNLEEGANLVIYPAGSLMRSNDCTLGGASGVHQILNEHPDTNVVLVRTRGLWGSIAGTAYTPGVSPTPGPLLKRCFKLLLQNLIFFMPRREVEIYFEPVGTNLPFKKDKLTFNRYLDDWYWKQPEIEPLTQVSMKFYKHEVPELVEYEVREISIEDIDEKIQLAVRKEIAQMASMDVEKVDPQSKLSADLGLDSLDRSELLIWLQNEYNVEDVAITELVTVGHVMEVAAAGFGKEAKQVNMEPPKKWKDLKGRPDPTAPQGRSIQESFLIQCDRMAGSICMADEASGILNWTKYKMGVLLVSSVLRDMPEERIGIMMPASVGAAVMVHAVLLAGKTPVMINWTLGPRNLEHVEELTGLQTVLTSFRFVERLGNIELGKLESKLLFIEDLRQEEFTLERKLRAFFDSRKSAPVLLKELQLEDIDPDSESVILFTSGSESVPKGVPLSHRNLLTNLTDVITKFKYLKHDVILGFLPPFHSFGYVITTILPTICGVKTAYYPNPTDARKLAHLIHYWGATLLYGTPSFINSILKAGEPEQLQTIEFIKVGAEKAPDELFEKLQRDVPKAQMVEGYGITECSPILSCNEPNKPRNGVGPKFPSVELAIVNPETYEPMDPSDTGMIIATGDSIFNGYLGNPRADVFLERDGKKWYITGDLGYINESGCVVLAGRKKRFVKVAGEMVSLPALETVLVDHYPATEEGPTLAVEALEREGDRPVMCLFTTVELTLEKANELLLGAGFSNVSRLNRVEQIEAIPVLGTGKTDYRSLKALLEEKVA